MSDGERGWPEYAKLVLAELKRHDGWLSNLDTQINNHVKHIEHRLTEIEATVRLLKWLLGFVITGLTGIFLMLLTIVLGT